MQKGKQGSIGTLVPLTQAKIIADNGKELGTNEPGELCVKGPQVMQGYWNMPEETKIALDEDGWLHTGDIATKDEDGYYYIVDRKKDMIKTGGENVYPREVEEALYQYPNVKEAVVVGLPDPAGFKGETIKAYVVLKDAVYQDPSEQERIRAFCADKLSKFKIPEHIEFREELPKTVVGKVLRRVLVAEELRKQKEISQWRDQWHKAH